MPRSLFRSSPRTATRIATLAVLALFVVTTASGCAERKETVGGEVSKSYLSLLLDWTPNPDHAGIYTGLAKKRFEAQGLSLKISNPSDAASVIQQVAAGRYDIGISYQPEVMSARDSGVKIKAVASIVPTPLNSLMWLKSSKVKNIKDLEGKRVGTSGAY
ncbi:MAG: ABC transporter substrate-binding protein, partial [Thermoleophilaceae bacterium]|nr:ABC transporter substrate-binding protein [Thermoleophilaceae bacterium]